MTLKLVYNPFTDNFDYIETYDLSLNTTDDVIFDSVGTDTLYREDGITPFLAFNTGGGFDGMQMQYLFFAQPNYFGQLS